MASGVSRYISADIKRQVRQRCCFGCVICGLPVYHYEHMEDFAVVQEHAADNITLLCPTHHQDKTSRRLPVAVVRRANESPYNSARNRTSSHRLYFDAETVEIDIGSNIFVKTIREGDTYVAIRLLGESVVSFSRENGELLLNLFMRDVLLNTTLEIVKGEITISTGVVDATFEGPEITCVPRFGVRKFAMRKHNNGIKITSGFFYTYGQTIEVTPSMITRRPGPDCMRGNYVVESGSGFRLD